MAEHMLPSNAIYSGNTSQETWRPAFNGSLWVPNGGWHPNHTIPSHQPNETFHQVQYLLDRYITTAICAFGCLGNVVTLVVLTRARYLKAEAMAETGAHVGLLALAISDLLFCIALLPRGFMEHNISLFKDRGFLLYYQAYGTGLVSLFILTSTWITVCMATLRYLAICHPLRLRALDGQRFAKVAYICVFIVCIFVNLPTFWQYRIAPIDIRNYTIREYILDIGHMDIATSHGMAYQWVRAAICIIIPALLLIFFNLSLILALRRSNKMRRQCYVKETASHSRNRITLTLVIIVSAFVVLVFPSELLDFFLNAIRSDSFKTEIFLLLRSIANILQVINFSFNFVLYCVINVNFRSTMRVMIGCTRSNGSSFSRSVYSTNCRNSPNVHYLRDRVPSHRSSVTYL